MSLCHTATPSPSLSAEYPFLSLHHQVLFTSYSAAPCAGDYGTYDDPRNDTLVFVDLDADVAEAAPIVLRADTDDDAVADDAADDAAARATAAKARFARAKFLTSARRTFHTNASFAGGELPGSWPCCDPIALSCRCAFDPPAAAPTEAVRSWGGWLSSFFTRAVR
jgi:hypothetical protein